MTNAILPLPRQQLRVYEKRMMFLERLHGVCPTRRYTKEKYNTIGFGKLVAAFFGIDGTSWELRRAFVRYGQETDAADVVSFCSAYCSMHAVEDNQEVCLC